MPNSSTYKARMLGLPEISSGEDLAFLLRLPFSTIKKYAGSNWGAGYATFSIPKKPVGDRTIHAPVRELKYIQAWILRNILDHLRSSPSSTAFEKNSGIFSNANRHVGKAYLINIDLRDFFPSITAKKVYQIFSSIGYDKEVSWLLTNLTTYRGALPQGSPASPKLANLICNRLDARVAGYCKQKNMEYTRYADDISVSMSSRAHIAGTLRFLKYVTDQESFSLRNDKTKVYGRKKAKIVTGLIVSDEVRVGRKKYRELRNLIYRALIAKDVKAENYVLGYMNFLISVDQVTWKQLREYQEGLKCRISEQSVLEKMIAA